MKRRGLKLNRGHRWSLYAVGLVLLFTGLAWMWMHRLAEADDLRESWRGLKPAIMSVHGLAAARKTSRACSKSRSKLSTPRTR